MKPIELPAYRAFMFTVVPQLYHTQTPSLRTPENAIAEAEYLWNAIDDHVLQVTKNVENG